MNKYCVSFLMTGEKNSILITTESPGAKVRVELKIITITRKKSSGQVSGLKVGIFPEIDGMRSHL